MTTAHRPTWAPAKGGEEQGGQRIFAPSRAFSAKDQPGHTKIKYRQPGQSTTADIRKRDLLTELEEKERKHFKQTRQVNFEEERQADIKLLEGPDTGPATGKVKVLVPKTIDADDEDADDGQSDDSSDDDDDSDEEAELLAELERIKKERAEEAARKAKEDAEIAQKEMHQEVARGNPLLNPGGFQVKRRWDDDVVFRNQTRGEPKVQKRFVNDTIRNDFHKRFLNRYIK